MENKTQRLDLFVPDPYISDHDTSRFKKALWFLCSCIFFQSSWFPISNVKIKLLRLFGAKIGKGVNIKPLVYIKYPWRLEIGNYVWIGEKVWMANESMVKIGNNVCISHEVLILCGGHSYSKEAFDVYNYPLTIEDGVWLGAQSTVLGGITVGSHAVLALKSVANKDLEPYSIYRGNPAVKIKDRVIV